MEPILEKRREEGELEIWSNMVNSFPQRVGDSIWSGPRGGGVLGKHSDYFEVNKRGGILEREEDALGEECRELGKKWESSALFISSGEEVPGRVGNRGGERPIANFLAIQIDCGVAVARNRVQCSLLAFFIALKCVDLAA